MDDVQPSWLVNGIDVMCIVHTPWRDGNGVQQFPPNCPTFMQIYKVIKVYRSDRSGKLSILLEGLTQGVKFYSVVTHSPCFAPLEKLLEINQVEKKQKMPKPTKVGV